MAAATACWPRRADRRLDGVAEPALRLDHVHARRGGRRPNCAATTAQGRVLCDAVRGLAYARDTANAGPVTVPLTLLPTLR